jgi:hypothetical protein
VVRESSLQRDGGMGLLTLAFLVACVRGVLGAHTTAGAIAAGVVFGGLVVIWSTLWIYLLRHASRLVVTDESVSLVRGPTGAPKVLTAVVDKHLQFVVRGSARSRTTVLQGHDPAGALGISYFSRAKVAAACSAHGWTVS